eukprot:TRINITY_DN14698_c0_g1_i4.p1 TRINITY_DN14698_c0_g1~~TRINITY_DN14698_c0_g1_i4.p1  ORF type:complete len:185 (-),score=12.46 TRINITY_DN14698_c0_g1_i4:382-936(-)
MCIRDSINAEYGGGVTSGNGSKEETGGSQEGDAGPHPPVQIRHLRQRETLRSEQGLLAALQPSSRAAGTEGLRARVPAKRQVPDLAQQFHRSQDPVLPRSRTGSGSGVEQAVLLHGEADACVETVEPQVVIHWGASANAPNEEKSSQHTRPWSVLSLVKTPRLPRSSSRMKPCKARTITMLVQV